MVCPPLPTGRRRTGILSIRCAFQLRPPNGKIVPCGTGNSRAERSRVFKVSCLLLKHCAGYVLFCVPKENQKGRRCPQGMKAPVGLLSRRPVCAANAACSARQGLRYFRGAGGGGLRLPASASCLARHSHPAGRCPNSSSLFRPLAAVVAVAN